MTFVNLAAMGTETDKRFFRTSLGLLLGKRLQERLWQWGMHPGGRAAKGKPLAWLIRKAVH